MDDVDDDGIDLFKTVSNDWIFVFGLIMFWTVFNPVFNIFAEVFTTALLPSADVYIVCPVIAANIFNIGSIIILIICVAIWVPAAKYKKTLKPIIVKHKIIKIVIIMIVVMIVAMIVAMIVVMIVIMNMVKMMIVVRMIYYHI